MQERSRRLCHSAEDNGEEERDFLLASRGGLAHDATLSSEKARLCARVGKKEKSELIGKKTKTEKVVTATEGARAGKKPDNPIIPRLNPERR